MAPPLITEDISFQHISSPLGMPGSPFDKALCNRDKIMAGYIKKINPSYPKISLADEIIAQCAAVYPGMGDFGPGGGPLV